MKKILIKIENAKNNEYNEFARILKEYGVDSKIVLNKMNDDEMGLCFEELVVFITALTPLVAQFRKAIGEYLIYKKPRKNKVVIILEMENKKLRIESENGELPQVDDFLSFLSEEKGD